MYILLNEKNAVLEIIPDENPIFPGVPIAARYAPEFCAQLRHFPDDADIEPNWVYDEETDTFNPPSEPEPEPEPEPVQEYPEEDVL